MKDTIFIGGLCAIILLVGAGLYFFEPEYAPARTVGTVAFTSIAEGQYANQLDTRTNYRIETQEELDTLWTLIHGTTRPALPVVDFEKNEVLAVFNGSHASGGYSVKVLEVVDSELLRTVHIEHRSPDESCVTTSVETSPYELIELPKMRQGLRLAHTDTEAVLACR